MLQTNAYFVANVGFDTAENESAKNVLNFRPNYSRMAFELYFLRDFQTGTVDRFHQFHLNGNHAKSKKSLLDYGLLLRMTHCEASSER